MTNKLHAIVSFNTEAHGSIDVDFVLDKFADLDVAIENGFGINVVSQIVITPHQYRVDDHPPNATIEALIRQLEQVDDIKHAATEGAIQDLARSSIVPPFAEMQTNAQSPRKVQPLDDLSGDSPWSVFERLARDILGGGPRLLAGPV